MMNKFVKDIIIIKFIKKLLDFKWLNQKVL
jgi:hypothetical protein